MQLEERRADSEPEPEHGKKAPEPATPPIDEDVASSVNAAVPDTEEYETWARRLTSTRKYLAFAGSRSANILRAWTP